MSRPSAHSVGVLVVALGLGWQLGQTHISPLDTGSRESWLGVPVQAAGAPEAAGGWRAPWLALAALLLCAASAWRAPVAGPTWLRALRLAGAAVRAFAELSLATVVVAAAVRAALGAAAASALAPAPAAPIPPQSSPL
jgi:hypothetical protein